MSCKSDTIASESLIFYACEVITMSVSIFIPPVCSLCQENMIVFPTIVLNTVAVHSSKTIQCLSLSMVGKMQYVVNNSQNYNIMRHIIIKHFISISGENWADLLNQRFLPLLRNILCSSSLQLRPKRVIRVVLEKKPSLILFNVFILVMVIELLHL